MTDQEVPKALLTSLPKEEQQKMSLTYYFASPSCTFVRRMVSSSFYRTEVFACGNFYKPLSKIFNDITVSDHE